MTIIDVERDLLEELLDYKLKYLHNEIEKILKKWNYRDPELFLQQARDGTIEEAEPDAITLRHLLKEREDAFQLRND
ncbi:MAG: hypothetical protein EU548_01855 [Promethearchaeota archaeon]|nr:MAG: hypothetical protein EU548_01855 [Candidatus Lokiarchaeota archaeon]